MFFHVTQGKMISGELSNKWVYLTAPGTQPLLPRLVRLENKRLYCAGGEERRKGDRGRLLIQVQRHQCDHAASVTTEKTTAVERVLHNVCEKTPINAEK